MILTRSNASKRCRHTGRLCIPWSDCSWELKVVWPDLSVWQTDCSLNLIWICKHCLLRSLCLKIWEYWGIQIKCCVNIFFRSRNARVKPIHGYCVVNPQMLSQEEFQELHFVPDPVLGDDGTYRNFDELTGYFKKLGHYPSLDLPRKSTEFRRKLHVFRGVFGQHFDDSAAVDGKLSNKEFYGIIYKCRGIHGILLQNLQISAADSTEFCCRFLPQIPRHSICGFDFCWSLIPRKVAAFESGIFYVQKCIRLILWSQ